MLAELIDGEGHPWDIATAIPAIHAITGPRIQCRNSKNRGNSYSDPQNGRTPPFSNLELIEYCDALGAQLLRDDCHFLLSHLPSFVHTRLKVMDDYLARWRVAASRELVQHKKQNVGRYAANRWLREQSLKTRPRWVGGG